MRPSRGQIEGLPVEVNAEVHLVPVVAWERTGTGNVMSTAIWPAAILLAHPDGITRYPLGVDDGPAGALDVAPSDSDGLPETQRERWVRAVFEPPRARDGGWRVELYRATVEGAGETARIVRGTLCGTLTIDGRRCEHVPGPDVPPGAGTGAR